MIEMILFFQSFINTFKSLSLIDFVFFAAVIALIVLVVTLIYFIKINNEKEEIDKKDDSKKNNTEIVKAPLPMFDDPEEGELYDLESISRELERRNEQAISLTDYEEEQEQKAIISYDELIEKAGNYKLNYEDEKKSGDVIIKKVDLDNVATPKKEEEKVRVISYEKEEAFLTALKKLQEQIN